MRNTAYYNLNIVDGTDIVNPLTVDNPNYEQIDEVMHNNAISGVTLATEIANANVHALTRENSECAVIRFIATSNWKRGDTITVDGLQVTALLPNGETLPDAAYVINANVLCILTGTNLTVFAERERIGREILDSNFEGFDTVLEWAIANPNSTAMYLKGVAPSDGVISYGKYWCVGRDLFASGITVYAQPNNSNIIFKRLIVNGAWQTDWKQEATIGDLDSLVHRYIGVGSFTKQAEGSFDVGVAVVNHNMNFAGTAYSAVVQQYTESDMAYLVNPPCIILGTKPIDGNSMYVYAINADGTAYTSNVWLSLVFINRQLG